MAVLDPPIGIWYSENTHPLLAPFRERLKGDLSTIRFTTVRELKLNDLAEGATVVFVGSDRRLLAVEMPVERGRIMLLTFGFELQRGNIARTRVFPALMWQLVNYLTGQLQTRPPDVLTASRPAVLDVSEAPFAFLNELELCPVDARGQIKVSRLPISEERTALLAGLPTGRYLLRKAEPPGDTARRTTYARQVAVNHDPKESDTRRVGKAELATLFGEGVEVLTAREAVDLAPSGGELWLPLIVLLALAYAAEGGVGWVLSARREKQRTAGTMANDE